MSARRYIRPAAELPEIGLDYLLARCTESDGCLLWTLQMRNGPVTHIKRQQYKVRHLVWHAVHGRAPQRSQLPAPTVCDNERCVHPDHLTAVKRNGHARGKKMPLLHRAHIAAAKRAGSGKIDLQQAAAIRGSSDTLEVLAQRHGISISLAHRIRAGEAWIDYGHNPFAQLMGAGA